MCYKVLIRFRYVLCRRHAFANSPSCNHTYSEEGIRSHLQRSKKCPVAGKVPRLSPPSHYNFEACCLNSPAKSCCPVLNLVVFASSCTTGCPQKLSFSNLERDVEMEVLIARRCVSTLFVTNKSQSFASLQTAFFHLYTPNTFLPHLLSMFLITARTARSSSGLSRTRPPCSVTATTKRMKKNTLSNSSTSFRLILRQSFFHARSIKLKKETQAA